jgi:hypothetical protein
MTEIRDRVRYMSDKEREAVYGHMCLQHKQLLADLSALKGKLHQIGAGFIGLGKQLEKLDAPIDQDRTEFSSVISSLWELVDKYQDAATKEERLKQEIDEFVL